MPFPISSQPYISKGHLNNRGFNQDLESSKHGGYHNQFVRHMKTIQKKENSKEQQAREDPSHGATKKSPMDKHSKIVAQNVDSNKEG
jgi:hypothetical protein